MLIGENEYNNVMLAPMARYTDICFRKLCRSCGGNDNVFFTEYIKSYEAAVSYIATKDEAPIVAQIMNGDSILFNE